MAMSSIQGSSGALEMRMREADVRAAEARLDAAARDEERAHRRREDAASDADRAHDRVDRVDRYA
jgi:hypothetical protein